MHAPAPQPKKRLLRLKLERALARRRGRRTPIAGRLPARRCASHRHKDRLRRRRVRRLHGAGRRRSRCSRASRSPRAAKAATSRRSKGWRRKRPHQPPAGGVSREARHAVRLLHAGHDHGGRGAAAPQSEPERDGDPRRAVRQSLPLHRLREDHRIGAGGGGAGIMNDGSPIRRAPHNTAVAFQPLIDGIEKVTGSARYTADLARGRRARRRILRSPVSARRDPPPRRLAARALTACVAVVTGDDCAHTYGVLPIAMNEYPLARDRVRYRGEPVAAVAAIDAETAERGARPDRARGQAAARLLHVGRGARAGRRAAARQQARQHRTRRSQ